MVLACFEVRENVNCCLLFLGIFTFSSPVFLSLLVYCGQWNSYFLLHIVKAVNQNLRYTERRSIDQFRLLFDSPLLATFLRHKNERISTG